MAGKRKKVAIFIVEGGTDEQALYSILNELFEDRAIRFHVVRGDLTNGEHADVGGILKEIYSRVKAEMQRYGYSKSDIVRIVQLIDTDGAFVPEENVLQNERSETVYGEESILCKNAAEMIARNRKKRQIVSKLVKTQTIARIPYEIFYFSRNMEHVLHDIGETLTAEEKIDLADAFAERYKERAADFCEYIRNEAFAAEGNYAESWDYIFDGTNSLKRRSNFHLLFADI